MSSMSNSNWRDKTGRMKLHAFNTLHYDVICKTSFLLEACVISKFPPSLTKAAQSCRRRFGRWQEQPVAEAGKDAMNQ